MPKIFEITPSAEDKLYGKMLNEHIQCFPDDCWICVRDDDTMYLQRDRKQIMLQAIMDKPDTDLFTCRTNRLMGQGISPDPNILNHHALAQNRKKGYVDIKGTVPAFFWLFPKRIWIERPFDEYPIVHRNRSFDSRWTGHVNWIKRRIEHLYVFHFYRLDKDPRDHSHLL